MDCLRMKLSLEITEGFESSVSERTISYLDSVPLCLPSLVVEFRIEEEFNHNDLARKLERSHGPIIHFHSLEQWHPFVKSHCLHLLLLLLTPITFLIQKLIIKPLHNFVLFIFLSIVVLFFLGFLKDQIFQLGVELLEES